MRRRLAALLLHAAIAALVVGPALLDPAGRLVGDPRVDVWNHAWGPWWWWTSLASGRLPWRTRLLGWPDGGVLWFIDPLLAAVGAPLVPLLGAAAAFDAAVFLRVLLASWAGRRLARALGAGPAASWVGAAALAGSAHVACALHNGITESAEVGLVALALAWTEEACDPAARRPCLRWARAGLGVGLAGLASPYLGLAAGIAAAIRGLRHLRRAWAGALVTAAVALPPVLALRAQLAAPDAVVRHPAEMNEELALHNAVDPRTFVAPLGFRSRDLSDEGFEHSMYLGLLALGLALAGTRRRHLGWWAGALACAALALGPYLYWGDDWVRVPGGGRLRLPWWGVQALVPGVAATHPLRLAVPALAVVAGLAAAGAERLSRGRAAAAGLLAAAVLLDGLVVSGAPWPVAWAPAEVPEALLALRRAPGEPLEEALLDLPTDVAPTMATSRYLWWQTGHGRPIPYGPDARASTSPLLSDPAFRVLAALCRVRPDERRRTGLASAPAGRTSPLQLRHRGIRWIAVHRDLDPEAARRLEARLSAELGPPRVAGDTALWDLARAALDGRAAPDPGLAPAAPSR